MVSKNQTRAKVPLRQKLVQKKILNQDLDVIGSISQSKESMKLNEHL